MDTTQSPHVLLFPLPLQGCIKGMVMLAELLSINGIHVTFLNTDHNHHHFLRYNATHHRFSSYANINFKTISDGLPEDHPRTSELISDLFEGLRNVTGPLFLEMLTSGSLSARAERPVTVVIVEGEMEFAIDAAEEAEIPLIYFETFSPCAFWACICVPRLINASELPFEDKDLDAPIKSIPGMEGILRCRDLPGFCRVADMNDPDMQNAMTSLQRIPRGHGIILNTFQELDEPILSHMQSLATNIYPIGPLHTHLKKRLEVGLPSQRLSLSKWEEDRSCLTWLDLQSPKSVIYVSIGSSYVMTKEQAIEFWHGLVNSGKRFLWVQRPNSITGGDLVSEISIEILKGTEDRGYIVSWAPQEEVLAHSAIGGFLTHAGWNSTLESIVEGVPKLCWPINFDQQVNSRFVSEVWKVGIDMKDSCDRLIIEKLIRDLMDTSYEGFAQHTDKLSKLAKISVSEGGSSASHFNRLVEDIKLISAKPTA